MKRHSVIFRARACALIALLSSLLGGFLFPLPAAAADPFTIKPVMTAAPTPDQTDPTIAGTTIAWADRRTGIFDVVTYDTDGGQEQRLALVVPLPAPGTERAQPTLDGQTLAWVTTPPVDEGGASSGSVTQQQTIGAYDLARNRLIPTPNIAPGQFRRPAISGGTIIYSVKRNGQWDVFGYDTATTAEFPIAVGSGVHGAVVASGGTLAYEVYRDGSWDIMGYNLKDKREFPIATGAGDQVEPQISGPMVVYRNLNATGGTPALMLYNVETKQSKTVAKDHFLQTHAISGDLVVWEDWRSGMPNVFAYDLKKSVEYTMTRSGSARAPFVAGKVIGWLTSGAFSARVTAVRMVDRLPTDHLDPPTDKTPDVQYFDQTGHFLKYGFKEFWQNNGALTYFGYPISEEFDEKAPDGQDVTVQFFERAKLEFVKATGKPRIGLVGTELTRGRDFPSVQPFPDVPDRRFFPETGHSLASGFKKYWDENNGATQFGFPISEELTENGLNVQYFERGRLEYHPELPADKRITLGRLGEELLEARGWIKPPPPDTTHFPER